MYLNLANFERIGLPRRDCRPTTTERAGAGVPCWRRVPVMNLWRAFLRKLHSVACLPELGGCEEELVDVRGAAERAVANQR